MCPGNCFPKAYTPIWIVSPLCPSSWLSWVMRSAFHLLEPSTSPDTKDALSWYFFIQTRACWEDSVTPPHPHPDAHPHICFIKWKIEAEKEKRIDTHPSTPVKWKSRCVPSEILSEPQPRDQGDSSASDCFASPRMQVPVPAPMLKPRVMVPGSNPSAGGRDRDKSSWSSRDPLSPHTHWVGWRGNPLTQGRTLSLIKSRWDFTVRSTHVELGRGDYPFPPPG